MTTVADQGTAPGRDRARAYRRIVLLVLAWNVLGCLDFTLTTIRTTVWLAWLPADVIDWLDAAPMSSVLTWAIAAWGGLCGALLLLDRSRWAIAAFAAALSGLALTQAWQWGSGIPAALSSPAGVACALVIWIAALAQLGFAVRQYGAGVLR